jgi:hypothetical protein
MSIIFHVALSYGYYMNTTSTIFGRKQYVEFISLASGCTSSDNSVAKPGWPMNAFILIAENIFSSNVHIPSSHFREL